MIHSDFEYPLRFPSIDTLGRMWIGARPLSDGAIHIVIVHADARRPGFYELQAVKNHVAGAARQAVEIYPPEAELVDEGGNSATHLWVLPEGAELRYTLKPKEVSHGSDQPHLQPVEP